MLHDGPSPGTMNGPSPDTGSPLHGLNYAIGTGNSLGRDIHLIARFRVRLCPELQGWVMVGDRS